MNIIKYKRLNYIESTGTQYIDTEINPKSSTRMILDLQPTDLTVSSRNGWGSSEAQEAYYVGCMPNYDYFLANVSNNWVGSFSTIVKDTSRHVFDVSNNSIMLDGVEFGQGTIGNTATPWQTLYLFALHTEYSNEDIYYQPAKERIYSCKIYDGDNLVSDFIPVLDNNNVACLYDTVSQMFFYNKGTGNFVAGEIQENVYYEDLIYDRTQEDVDYALSNPQSELILKGAYNYTDLNRIEAYSRAIAQELNTYNYSVNITSKTNWTNEDFPTKVEMKRIRDNVQQLKNAFTSFTSVPANLERMTFEKANDLERVLYELDTLINNMIASFYYSGEIYSGEV